jgi:hypothetical protein
VLVTKLSDYAPVSKHHQIEQTSHTCDPLADFLQVGAKRVNGNREGVVLPFPAQGSTWKKLRPR